jgi:hypothetical protein
MSDKDNEERTLCDWSKKEIRAEFDQLVELVAAPAFVCRKCARAAARESALCKPTRLPTA